MPISKPKVIEMDDINCNQLVVKSNNLVEASYRLSTQEQRILLLVASMIKPEDEDFQEYHIEVKNFMELIGVTGHSKYKETKEITKKLRERTIVIKNIQEDSETQVGWVSSFTYYNREGYVVIRLDPALKPYLLKLKERFTQYQLKNVIRLQSAYSIRIYELLKQFEKIKERYFELPELRKILGLQSTDYPLYANFKQKILNKTQKEISEKTDLMFEFKEKKEARKVVGVYFFIKPNCKKQEPELPEPEESENLNIDLYLRLQKHFCLSTDQAREALKMRSEEDLLQNMAYVEMKYKKGEVDNIGAYAWRIINGNIKAQMSIFDIEKDKKKKKAEKEEAEKRRQESLESEYREYKGRKVEEYKTKIEAGKLAELEADVEKEIKEQGKIKFGVVTFIRHEVDKRLAEMAGIPSLEEWVKGAV
jgi:plasmid replication initiation protein